MTRLVPDQAPQYCMVEGDCQSPGVYQDQIYLKSDNHVVHLVKSSGPGVGPCARREHVECVWNGRGWHGSDYGVPA